MIIRRARRGFSLMEVLGATVILAGVLTAVLGIVVQSTRSFAREQDQTLSQFRARTTVDELAEDLRSAVCILPATDLPTNTAAIKFEVPCRTEDGILFNGMPSLGNLVRDTLAYYVVEGELHRLTSVGNASSVRESGNVVVATGVGSLTFTMRDAAGAVTNNTAEAVEVELVTTVGYAQGLKGACDGRIAVRLRNNHPETP